MSKGNDSRAVRDSDGRGQKGRSERSRRSSRTSVPMTAERARAIQAHADKNGRNQDFKARAMAAAARHEADEDEG